MKIKTIKNSILKFLCQKMFIWLNEYSLKGIKYFDKIDIANANSNWKRLFDGKEKLIFEYKNDLRLNLFEDSLICRFIYDGFEELEINFMLNLLKPGDIFIDIGANIGMFSTLASKEVGSSGKVVSFEPFPETFSRLSQNIKLNDLENVDLRNIGLSYKPDNLMFYYSDNGFDAWNSFAPSNDFKLKKSINIRVSTLDSELNDLDKTKIKFIKIDVEGWEKFVIQGGQRFFREYSPVVMVEFSEQNCLNAGYFVCEIFYEMEKLGYTWYRIEKGKLVKEEKQLNYTYSNLIAKK